MSYGGKAEQGTTQGDPLSGPYFCVVIHKLAQVQMRSGLVLQASKLVLYALLTGDMSP